VGTARRRLQDVLAFVKTFHEREFGSIYCEREWRATTVFPFELSDVAMIVLPKGGRNPSYLRVPSARALGGLGFRDLHGQS
jgi:hypothetical protein